MRAKSPPHENDTPGTSLSRLKSAPPRAPGLRDRTNTPLHRTVVSFTAGGELLMESRAEADTRHLRSALSNALSENQMVRSIDHSLLVLLLVASTSQGTPTRIGGGQEGSWRDLCDSSPL